LLYVEHLFLCSNAVDGVHIFKSLMCLPCKRNNMSVMNYKCPACGAPIEFNPRLGKFKCGYCFTEHTEEALTAYLEKLQAKTAAADGSAADTAADKEGAAPKAETENHGNAEKNAASGAGNTREKERQTVKAYQCANCGAEVVAGDTSTAAFCYYCHSPVVITDRLQGDFKPDRIIPFKVDKKTAVQKFLEWAGKKKFTPKGFTSEMQQEKITGVYLPYWQADIDAKVDYHAVGVTVTRWSSGDRDYVKTDKYKIDRVGDIAVNNLQKLAFSKIDESLLNTITPYDEAEMKNFSAGYLAGFFAEQYTENKEAVTPALMTQAKQTTAALIKESASCTHFESERDSTTYTVRAQRYVLLPSWILTYIYHGKPYVFAVNGQTGKTCGELPLDKAKVALTSGLLGVVFGTLMFLGGMFIW